MNWTSLFLSPNGRIGRRDFWIGFVIVMVASLLINLIPGGLGALIGLLTLWPQICIHAKRLHDMDRTAWLMLLPGVVSVLAGIVGLMTGAMGSDGPGGVGHPNDVVLFGIGAVIVVVGVGFLLWVGLTRGTEGPNTYGVPPRRKAAA